MLLYEQYPIPLDFNSISKDDLLPYSGELLSMLLYQLLS